MPRIACSWLTVLLLLATPALATDSGAKRTLTGTYVWFQGGDEGDVEAVFTPAGERQWSVSFRFDFGGSSHTYSGTADGSLEGGTLSGRVRNENGRRTFTFQGEFRDGQFRGTHAEIMAGEEERTGTLTLGSRP